MVAPAFEKKYQAGQRPGKLPEKGRKMVEVPATATSVKCIECTM